MKEFNISSTRPTLDRVRESIFDKIGQNISGSLFLDLFSGTGACGIEAISRGARKCVFVDKNKEAVKLIKENTSFINQNKYSIFNKEYEDALCFLAKEGQAFDYIFLDPPYRSDYAEEAIKMIGKLNLLKDGGCIIWEHDISKKLIIDNEYSECLTRKYGDKYVTYVLYGNIVTEM